MIYQKKKFQTSFPDTGKAHVRPRTPHLCMRQDTLTHTYWLKYIDSCADILYKDTLVMMNLGWAWQCKIKKCTHFTQTQNPNKIGKLALWNCTHFTQTKNPNMKGKVLHLVMSSIYRFRLLAFIVFKQLFHLNIILSSIRRFN